VIVISMVKTDLQKDREKRIKSQEKMLEEAKKGVFPTQAELRIAPWKVTWDRMDMIMERQERTIALLEQLVLDKKKK